MTRVNKICMSILMLGAAAVAAPAMAQDTSANANANANATENAQAAAPADNGQAANADTSAANQSSASAGQSSASAGQSSASANQQTAMNTTSGSSSSPIDASTLGNTSKKYHRATRVRDFRAEKKITAQLNQQASAAAAPNTQTAMNR